MLSGIWKVRCFCISQPYPTYAIFLEASLGATVLPGAVFHFSGRDCVTAGSQSDQAARRAFPVPVMVSTCFLDPTKVSASGQNSTPAKSRCDGISLAKCPADRPSRETDPKHTLNPLLFGLSVAPLTPSYPIGQPWDTVLLPFCKGATS